MNVKLTLLVLLIPFIDGIAQNIQITGIRKIYYYKTMAGFFNNKKDSIVGEDIFYDYGKVSYVDKKSNKKIKFHLHKDSSIFAFRIVNSNGTNPIYAIHGNEKRYGVYMGGNKDLMCIFYSRGDLHTTRYDQQNYLIGYSGTIDEFGYYIGFVKKGLTPKKSDDIEFVIQDKPDLYKKYIDERNNATTFYWNKNFLLKQVEYMRLYNR